MTSTTEPPSSPAVGGSSIEEDLAYYKAQYEQLEVELQEFQASSRELEAELEKDIEASEKRERGLKEKVEALGFEVEEWKAKYKQSKTEANGAQNALQREITALRDQNRTLQLTLRDIEVANDEHERQARYQISSLEDLEQKYNVSIERGVMLEEEIKVGEQEREDLRIENQRLRDELSDITIEADIIKEKLRLAEDTVTRFRDQKARAFTSAEPLRPRSPVSETSTSATTVSSPTMSTPPPTKEKRSSVSTPPSPPPSEFPEHPKDKITPVHRKRSIAVHDNTTPRPSHYTGRTRHTRAPSSTWSSATPSGRNTPGEPKTRTRAMHSHRPSSIEGGLPRSSSLYQIRGLIGKMQKLEARVHNVRSKLPAPTHTPPRASPRNGSAQGNHSLPSNVTVRSSRKRTSGSTNSSVNGGQDNGTGVSKLTFGNVGSKAGSGGGLGPFGSGSSRPSSRASNSDRSGIERPTSRTSHTSGSLAGRTTPMGHYSTSSTTEARRPRSNVSRDPWGGDRYGGRATLTHNHSKSVNERYGRSRALSRRDIEDDDDDDRDRVGRLVTPPSTKRADFSRSLGSSGIPTPTSTGIPTPSGLPRRTSISRRMSTDRHGAPDVKKITGRQRGYSEVGETW